MNRAAELLASTRVGWSTWLGVFNVMSKRSSRAILKAVNASVNATLLCGLLCCLMPRNSAAEQVSTTSQHHAAIGQASRSNAAALIKSERDAGGRNDDASPRRDGLNKLEVMLTHWRMQLITMLISGLSVGYTVGKWRAEKLMQRCEECPLRCRACSRCTS